MNKEDFEKICDINNLYNAYKKSKHKDLNFQSNTTEELQRLKQELETKIYKVSPYHEFTVYEPKERLIKACSFKDKVVQHSICDNVLLPKLKEEFIQTNYAGQIGKGTHYGLNYLKAQMYLAYCKYGYDCWIIKADISKYFYNINHDILKDIVRMHIKDDDV